MLCIKVRCPRCNNAVVITPGKGFPVCPEDGTAMVIEDIKDFPISEIKSMEEFTPKVED